MAVKIRYSRMAMDFNYKGENYNPDFKEEMEVNMYKSYVIK